MRELQHLLFQNLGGFGLRFYSEGCFMGATDGNCKLKSIKIVRTNKSVSLHLFLWKSSTVTGSLFFLRTKGTRLEFFFFQR